MIVDTIVEVKDLDDLGNALKVLKKKPVKVVFKNRELFDLYEQTLRKYYILYTITEMTDKEVGVILILPENIFNIDRRIEEKSYYLANPEVISYTIRVSTLREVSHARTPLELAKQIVSACRYGYSFLVLRSEAYNATAYIICKGGEISAVVYKESSVTIGKTALRIIFYRGPYSVAWFEIRREMLR